MLVPLEPSLLWCRPGAGAEDVHRARPPSQLHPAKSPQDKRHCNHLQLHLEVDELFVSRFNLDRTSLRLKLECTRREPKVDRATHGSEYL